jgi:hypothetical protein
MTIVESNNRWYSVPCIDMRKFRTAIFIGMIFVIVLGSLFQAYLYIIHAPFGFTFPWVHNYEQDYYWYLSLMRQGWDGSLAVTSKYSGMEFPPQIVNTFFPILGMIAKFIGVNLPVMYTFIRIVGGVGVLIVGYHLSKKLQITHDKFQTIQNNQILNDQNTNNEVPISNNYFGYLALLLMIFCVPFWFFENGQIKLYGEFWTGFDPILRIAYLPHHLFANIFGMIAIIQLIIGWDKKTVRHFILAGVCAFIVGWLNPGTLGVIFMAVVLGVGFSKLQIMYEKIIYKNWNIKNGSWIKIIKKWKPIIVGLSFFLFSSGLSIGGLLLIQQSTFPWTEFKNWERFQMYPIDVFGLFNTLGIVGILACIAIPFALSLQSFGWNVIAAWFLIPFLGLGILVYYLPYSNSRYLQGVPYVPSAILASLFIYKVSLLIERLFKFQFSTNKLQTISNIQISKFKQRITIVVLLVFIVFISFPSFYASIQRQLMYIDKNRSNPVVYVQNRVFPMLSKLDQKNNEGSILAPGWMEILIPAYTHYHSVFGHPTFTYKSDETQWKAYEVLNLRSFEWTNDFLKENRVKYIMIESDPISFSQFISAYGYNKILEYEGISVFEKI